MRRSVVLIGIILALILVAAAPAHGAGIKVGPPSINVESIPVGNTSDQYIVVYNSNNSTPLMFTVASNDPAIKATPANGTIPANGSTPVKLSITPTTAGSYNSLVLVNSTSQINNGANVLLLPAIGIKVHYSTPGAQATPQPSLGLSTNLLAALVVIAAVIVIAAIGVGVWYRRR